MEFIKDGKSLLKLCIKEDASIILYNAVKDIADASEKITGVRPEIIKVKTIKEAKSAIIVALFSDENLKEDFKEDYEYIKGTDGFAIREKDGNLYVLGDCNRGASYGAHDLMERNADVIWARGSKEGELEVLEAKEMTLKEINYNDKSQFPVRVWNVCGYGTDNVFHGDKGTAITMARNKIIGVYHHCDDDWRDYGVTGQSLASEEFRGIDELIPTHPEYFMTYEDGTPRRTKFGGSNLESYVNYYHPEVPKIIAKKMVKYIKEKCKEGDVLGYNMPDNPYFYMYHNGVKLHEQPFTTDCGVTVYPDQPNYKSTVYFNFINRLIKEINKLLPGTIIHTQSYMYTEPAPAIKVDGRVYVKLVALASNIKVPQDDPVKTDNITVRDNFIAWSKCSESLCSNAHWDCFPGWYYSRPIWKVAQADIRFAGKLGFVGFTPEGKVDCSKLESYTRDQLRARKFYDFNEMYVWGLSRLIWNPERDLEEMKKHYCRIVYKECYEEMLEYYNLVEKGYEETDAYIFCIMEADVYIYQFLLKAGVAEGVLKTLEKALKKVKTETVKDRIESIYETLKYYIDQYMNFEDEDAEIMYCGKVNPISEEQMDYESNKDSVWNKAPVSKVIKKYGCTDNPDPRARVTRKMLYDDKNAYFGYEMYDDEIVGVEEVNGTVKVKRENGTEVSFRAETYFGGNSYNMEIYYGYTSGFNRGDNRDHYYINENTAIEINEPDGVKTVRKVYLSNDKEKRKLFFVQVIPLKAMDVALKDFRPYGHFMIYSDKYGEMSWKGFGAWAKQNFNMYKLV